MTISQVMGNAIVNLFLQQGRRGRCKVRSSGAFAASIVLLGGGDEHILLCTDPEKERDQAKCPESPHCSFWI